ncbi:DUF948 domain-containing protein [Oceanobacillus longus]|uniref:DUF948 domain-containing protein n=1 Tax=Oceanobacillus longus TaxID=930120 RepID=A0ABV8H0D2_9BACI
MTLVGIGVLLIGVAFIILAIFIGHALNNLAGVLSGIDKTVKQLPNQLDNVFKETGNMISESNNTLADVNDKLHQLSPLFYIVGDVGSATRKFSSSLVDVTDSMKTKTDGGKEVSDGNKLGGLYGSFALGYYWLKKRQEMKVAQGESANGNR